MVVSADPVAFAAKYPGVTASVVGPWTGRLSNSGERIRLRDAAGEEVDELTYADEGDWAVRRRGEDDNGHQAGFGFPRLMVGVAHWSWSIRP